MIGTKKGKKERDDHSVGYVCRDIRHAWDHLGDVVLIEQNKQVRHFARTLVCLRCSTRRIDEYKVSSYALGRVRTKYEYPEGYHVPGGISVEEVRIALFKDMTMVQPAGDTLVLVS
jgi:hypothetical protein